MKSLKHLIALPLTCTLLLTITSLHAQRIGIGTTNPDPSAILEITSDSLGVLIPRMTAAERDAIMNPATGLMVFVTNDSSFYCFEGSAWQMVGGRGYMLVDADGDTKIQVEESPDEDILRIDLGGTEYFRMDNGRIHVLNTGNSVFLGDSAGISDDLDANKNVFIGHAAGQNSETGFLNVGIGHNSFYNNTTGGRNVATGAGSLFNNTSGFYNVASGQAALYNNTSGNGNVAGGYNALVGNTTGQHNVGLGYLSLKLNTVGIGNIAVGAEAGFNALDTGSIFLGYRAGYFETAGNRLYIENSTADSANALIYGEFDNDWLRINGHLTATMGLSDADHDTKIQVEEGADDDTIRFDIQGTEYYRMEEGRIHVGNTGRTVLIGRAAGSSQNLGSLDNTDNTFVGDSTGTGISLGNYNTAMGSKALSGGGGFHNVAIGFAALRSYSGFGGFNTALGTRAGYNATGRYNVFLGHEAGYHETKDSTLYISSTDADSANALIYGEFDNKWLRVNGYLTPALGLSDADHDTKIQVEKDPDDDKIRFETNGTEFFRMTDGRLEILNSGGSVRIGEGAGGNVSAADLEDKITANVFIGRNAGANHDTTGNKLVGIGGDALRFNENGDYNVAIGYRSMYANIGGHSNVALGLHTLYSNTNGKYNIAVGMKALEESQSAEANTAVGYEALQSHTSGNNNTAVGYRALWEDTGGTQNTAIGREAMYKNNSSENNTGVGYRALYNNGNGNRNTGIGRNALHDNTNGDENTALGNEALSNNATGMRNLALGNQAGFNSTGDSSIYIGNKAGYFETAGDRLYIENSDAIAGNALIYGEFDNDLLAFNADVGIGTTAPEHNLHVIGHSLFRDTLRSTLTLQTDDNSKDVGLAFKRPGDNFEWSIFREGGSTDLVISGGPHVPNITNLVEYMRITDDGDVGIGTSAPNALLTVNGVASKPGGGMWVAFSDLRLKDVHGSFDYGLDAVMQLQPVIYNYQEGNPVDLPSDETFAGFVAQDVQRVIPEAVDDAGEYLQLDANAIYLAMLNSIKELKRENDALKAKNDAMEDRLARIEAMLIGQETAPGRKD